MSALIPADPVGGNAPTISAAVDCGDLEIATGGTINMTGTGVLSIYGNLHGSLDLTDGEVVFAGSSTQNISQQSTFYDLTINNPTTVTLANAQALRGALDLVSGTLITGGNTFTLISDASGTARVAPVTSGSISGGCHRAALH